VRRLLSLANNAAAPIQADLGKLTVGQLDAYGSLRFYHDGAELGDKLEMVFSALHPDVDTVDGSGPYLNFLLFTAGNQLAELQVYKDDGEEIQCAIDPEKLAPWGTKT